MNNRRGMTNQNKMIYIVSVVLLTLGFSIFSLEFGLILGGSMLAGLVVLEYLDGN